MNFDSIEGLSEEEVLQFYRDVIEMEIHMISGVAYQCGGASGVYRTHNGASYCRWYSSGGYSGSTNACYLYARPSECLDVTW